MFGGVAQPLCLRFRCLLHAQVSQHLSLAKFLNLTQHPTIKLPAYTCSFAGAHEALHATYTEPVPSPTWVMSSVSGLAHLFKAFATASALEYIGLKADRNSNANLTPSRNKDHNYLVLGDI